MQEVKVKITELREIIAKNRKDHRDIFLEAQKKYREKAIQVLDQMLAAAREGRGFELFTISSLQPPQDHTSEYDRALQMLEMSVDTVIVLNKRDFANLVQDDWDWSRSWAVSNSNYTSHPKLSSALNKD